MRLSEATTYADNAFANVDNIDVLVLDGANTVTFNSDADTTGFATVIGGNGNSDYTHDTGFLSAVTFIGGNGDDTFRGTLAALASDSIDGGLGENTWVLTNASALANDGDFDRIQAGTVQVLITANGDNDITLGSNADTAGISTLIGGAGNDDIDASAYTSNLTFIATLGGSDTFLGGSGNDDVLFANNSDLASSNVDGGTGTTDAIRFTGADAFVDANFTNVTNIDEVFFANGTNSITIDTEVAAAGVQTLTGGTGADSFTKTNATVMTLVGGTGDDVFTFSTAAIFAADSIAGGANNDTIVLSEDTVTLNDSNFDLILSVESFTTANGDNDLTLGSNADNVAGILTVTGGMGNDDIDASAYDSEVTLNGGSGGSDTLTGGSGADRLKAWSTSGLASTNAFNDTLTGGSGADVFVLGDTISNAYGQASMDDASNYRAAITDFNADADIFELFLNGATGNFSNNGTNLISIRNSDNTKDVYRLAYNDTSKVASLYQVDGAGGLLGIATVNNYTGTFADNTAATNFNLVG